MTTSDETSPFSGAQTGRVEHLNIDAGFGYVRDAAGVHHYIFVVRKACPWAVFGSLAVGQPVRFTIDDAGRVVRLVNAASGRS